MNVLSLFDGMSCGQIALNKLKIEYYNYFACEIDKYAIEITQKNFPNTKQLGDVTLIKGEDLPKIDLLIGGSPCQGFSFAGKQLNFEDPRSALFFEYVRLLKECKPTYFLLENVKMKKEFQDVISEYLGVEPILINSSLVSAQNRERLYWTNIPNVTQPIDKKLVLKDIMEDLPFKEGLEKYTYEPRVFKEGSLCHHIGDGNFKGGLQLKRVYAETGKSPTLTTISGGCQEKKVSNNRGLWRELSPIEYERLQTVPENYTEGVKKSARYTMLGNGWTVDVIAHIFKNIEKK
jgi:DNA (cytosine-5)-methyltransferase 3A